MAKAKIKKNASGGATEQSTSSKAPSMSVCDWLNIIWNVIGVLAAIGLAYHHMWYCYIQHENEMWFTNIKEVEREISFRTESGLYYSYFKQTVQGNTFRGQRSKYRLFGEQHQRPDRQSGLVRIFGPRFYLVRKSVRKSARALILVRISKMIKIQKFQF